MWGRYAKIKGAKPGDVTVTKQGDAVVVKGRIDSVAPGTEGDWASIDGVVERIAPATVQIRGEVAFRVAKVEKGTPCKVGGLLHFKRSGKSQVWRLAEGDNPCDGMRGRCSIWSTRSRSRRSRCRPSPSAADLAAGEPAAFRSRRAPAASARSFSRWPLWPFTQLQWIWCGARGGVEALPQLDILHRLLVGGAPAVLLPAVDPLGDAVHARSVLSV